MALVRGEGKQSILVGSGVIIMVHRIIQFDKQGDMKTLTDRQLVQVMQKIKRIKESPTTSWQDKLKANIVENYIWLHSD